MLQDGYITELMVREIDMIEKHRSDNDFLNFLYNVIPPNEMEKYREMYNCKNDKNNC